MESQKFISYGIVPQIQSGFLLTVSTAREGQQKYTKRLATVNQTKPDQKLQFIQEKESVQWF